MNKRRAGDYRPDSWWVREYGGMPGWAIVVLAMIILGIFGAAVVLQLGG